MSKSLLFAVFGDPIIHSKSPVLWNAAFSKLKKDAVYFKIKTDDAKTVAALIKTMGLRACNITTPLKESVMEFLDIIDPVAKKIGAVNTIVNNDGILSGYNTDWIGVVDTLKNNKSDPVNKKVIVLGAGGAAKAAVFGLLNANVSDLVIINRTMEKANLIVKHFDDKRLRSASLTKLYDELNDADILVSCVPKLEEVLDYARINESVKILCADYKKDVSKKFIQGTDWLLYQAVASFKIVFGEEPVAVMKSALKNHKAELKRKISIIGFMGSGKTTISKELALQNNWKFIDTDEEIVKKEKISIPEIFKNKSEDYFRKIEKEVLKSVIDSDAELISTGGGIVLNKDNAELLKKTVRIWVWADIKQIMERIDTRTRPLLSEERFYQRIPFYAANSDICVVNSENVSKICRSLIDEINKAFKS